MAFCFLYFEILQWPTLRASFTRRERDAILRADMKTSGAARPRRRSAAASKRKRSGAKPPIVFVSPSFDSATVRKFAAGVDVRRPIRTGELATIEAGRLVAIIDGANGEHAVTTSEIRAAIGRGVRVVGSAGIGAARAAELRQMMGVGETYEMYLRGELAGDDEVIVLLDDAGRHLTEPLANVRFAVARLTRSGTLSPKNGEAIVKAATALHFRDRTYANIVRKAGLASKEDSETLVRALKTIDLRRDDSITMLEQLAQLARDEVWSARATTQNAKGKAAPRSGAKREASTEAPLLIWELGESIDFSSLVHFLAVTGRLESYARNALFRYLVDGGSISQRLERKRGRATTAQDLVEEISDAWGWTSSEELQSTLVDLGFTSSDFGAGVNEEHVTRVRVRSLVEKMPKELLRALRFELLNNDLALKREAMRMSALQSLADEATSDPTGEELHDAKLALLGTATRRFRAETWSDLVDLQGLSAANAANIVRLVALARRKGVPLLERMESAPASAGTEGLGARDLPIAPYPEGRHRSIADADAFAVAKLIADAIGISRIAQLSELDRIGGLHVTAAYRSSIWNSIASGKGESIEGATVGAIMEETERYCQDVFEPGETVTRSYQEMDPSEAVDPIDLHLPYDSPYKADRPIQWTWANDLVSGKKLLVPLAALENTRTQNDPYFSAKLSRKWFSTNGLASGFTLTEALSHALCERIERHAYKLSEQDEGNPGNFPWPRAPLPHVDLRTCPASTRRICEQLKASGGYEVRVTDITCEVTVPTFYARVIRPSSRRDDERPVDYYGPGCCTHPNAEVAINRAILEGVQSLLMNVDGASDIAMNVRSLGRHERPRPNGIAESSRLQPWVSKRPFSANSGLATRNARDEVTFIVRRLTAASFDRVLYRDLSTEKTMPARVVRVLIPGMEDINPLYTGPRARVRTVTDLMRRHEW